MNKSEIEAQIANLQESLKKITIKEMLDVFKAEKGCTNEELLEALGVDYSRTESRYPYTETVTLFGNCKNTVTINNENQEKIFKIFLHLFEKIGYKNRVFNILLPDHSKFTNEQRYLSEYVCGYAHCVDLFKLRAITFCQLNVGKFKDSVSYLSSI